MTSSDSSYSYSQALKVAQFCWDSAISHGMSLTEALAFVYDEMDVMLRKSDPWIRAANYLALFKVAHAGGLMQLKSNGLEVDVVKELRDALDGFDRVATEEFSSEADRGLFRNDKQLAMRVCNARFQDV